jgi:hypothetical protein
MSLDIPKKRTIDGFTFTLEDSCYECKGDRYFDDEHDQVPEPKLQKAASKLQGQLQAEGIPSEIEFGEKGWIEVYITN